MTNQDNLNYLDVPEFRDGENLENVSYGYINPDGSITTTQDNIDYLKECYTKKSSGNINKFSITEISDIAFLVQTGFLLDGNDEEYVSLEIAGISKVFIWNDYDFVVKLSAFIDNKLIKKYIEEYFKDRFGAILVAENDGITTIDIPSVLTEMLLS